MDGKFEKKLQTFSSLASVRRVIFRRILFSRTHEIAIFLNYKFQAHVSSASNLILEAGYRREILKKIPDVLPCIASIDGTSFKFFLLFHSEYEIAGIPDF